MHIFSNSTNILCTIYYYIQINFTNSIMGNEDIKLLPINMPIMWDYAHNQTHFRGVQKVWKTKRMYYIESVK
jgi:hypothetical protein